MTKFNEGDRVRLIKAGLYTDGFNVGSEYHVTRYAGSGEYRISKYVNERDELVTDDFAYVYANQIVLVPETDRRLTEAEAKIAALEAEVKALKGASNPSMNVTINASHVKDAREFAAGVAEEMRRGLITPKQSPNQRRADVIKRAQAFVAEYSGVVPTGETPLTLKCGDVRTEFVVNAEKRTVVAIGHYKWTGGIAGKAFAKCAPDDVFNADIGKAIAAGRLYGVKVPKEFTDAPKPTEVVVGMGVDTLFIGGAKASYGTRTVTGVRERKYPEFRRGTWASKFVIVDDTDAVYE